jgi:hypothetical protein
MNRLQIAFSVAAEFSRVVFAPPALDFGVVHLNEQITLSFTISNLGAFPVDFELAPNDKLKLARPSSSATMTSARTRGRSGGAATLS